MTWIVLGEKNGRIQLVSKGDVSGILPKGSYLTIEENKTKFILRVDDSQQTQPYSPSAMIIDMDLKPLQQDQKCQNILNAYRVKDLTQREDGFIDYIRPQSVARRSTQEEVNLAMNVDKPGPKVFLATIHSSQNQLLIDGNNNYINTSLPEDMFFHQTLICGKTGSGKTVAIKYLAQYFIEKLDGAVLAVNVKESDLLRMNKPSETKDKVLLKEWASLKQKAHGVDNFIVYYPANIKSYNKKVDPGYTKEITLNVIDLDPESLSGLLLNITDLAAQSLPSVFRHCQEDQQKKKNKPEFTFSNFVNYFLSGENSNLEFPTLSIRCEPSVYIFARGTFENIKRSMSMALDFFDNPGAHYLTEEDILQNGKMSVIDVEVKNGRRFGAILLRELLHKIRNAKNEGRSKIPILIVIDEVHSFYRTDTMEEALGDLDLICREGRSQKMAVIFASQNPSDIPSGLSSVINTKIFFKTDTSLAKSHGVLITPQEMESLKAGFAAVSIHDLPQAKMVKFPLSFSGVLE